VGGCVWCGFFFFKSKDLEEYASVFIYSFILTCSKICFQLLVFFLGAEQKELSSRLQIDPVIDDTLQVTQG